jgi:hypothetical protein
MEGVSVSKMRTPVQTNIFANNVAKTYTEYLQLQMGTYNLPEFVDGGVSSIGPQGAA